jgi:hypothetical protein
VSQKAAKLELMMSRFYRGQYLSLYSQEQFKNHLVILSEKRVKWIRTA